MDRRRYHCRGKKVGKRTGKEKKKRQMYKRTSLKKRQQQHICHIYQQAYQTYIHTYTVYGTYNTLSGLSLISHRLGIFSHAGIVSPQVRHFLLSSEGLDTQSCAHCFCVPSWPVCCLNKANLPTYCQRCFSILTEAF